jgi:hypothetical protein
MFKKKHNSLHQATWSKTMLKEFLDHFNTEIPQTIGVPLNIKERVTVIDFNTNEPTFKSVYYRGFLAIKKLENVYFSLSTWDEETKEYQHFIGFLELLNGTTFEEGLKVPMIRGFIKSDLKLFETVDILIRDAKIFNSNNPIILNIHVEHKFLSYANTENLLNNKIGIRNIEVHQRLSTS